MADETFYKGDIRLLYIKEGVDWYPVSCITGSPFNEEAEMVPTTTRENNGWETQLPISQRYTIEFNGLQILTVGSGDTTKMSYDRLKTLKRERTKIEWKIEDAGGLFNETGFGYIQNIGESNESGGMLEFSGSIVGYGEY